MNQTHVFLTALNQYSPTVYGQGNNLSGCISDLERVKTEFLRRSDKYIFMELKDRSCTVSGLLRELDAYSATLQPGDRLIWFHSGHGTWFDKGKETLCGRCLYDGVAWDYLVLEKIKKFKPGVELVFLSDTCHSESNSRALANGILQRHTRPKSITLLEAPDLPKLTKGRVSSKLPYCFISACKASQVSWEDSIGGVFTTGLIKAIRKVGAEGSVKALYDAVLEFVPHAWEQNAILENNKAGALAILKKPI